MNELENTIKALFSTEREFPNSDTYIIDGEGPWFLSSQDGILLEDNPEEMKKWPSYKIEGKKIRYDIQKIERPEKDPLGIGDVEKEYNNIVDEVHEKGYIHYSLYLDELEVEFEYGAYEGYIVVLFDNELYACMYQFEKNINKAIKELNN